MIAEGEHQHLDFKFEISDSKKIARSFSAFANTDGGKLLIGVKDNGAIAGVRSEEEYYMVEAAAEMYCKPAVKFETREWGYQGKVVLEVDIPKSEQRPHLAPGKDGKWMAYLRVHDENRLANDVLIRVWKNRKKKQGVKLRYSENEKKLLDYLEENQSITLTKFCKIARLTRFQAKKILVDLISIEVVDMEFTDKLIVYRLATEHAEG